MKLHEKYYGDKYPEFMNQQIRPAEIKPQVQPELTQYLTRKKRWDKALDCVGFVFMVFLLWGILALLAYYKGAAC